MSNRRHAIDLNFDAQCVQCLAPVAFGARRCRRHLEAQHYGREDYGYWKGRGLDLLLRPPASPLAAWLNDPSLLPKRPPGMAVAA